MSTVIVFCILTPIAAGALFLVARRLRPMPATDDRGIALQTIIVMVVLLAIAGAVAAVLLTRAGEESSRLDDVRTDIGIPALASASNAVQCAAAGGAWNGGSCSSAP